MQNDILLSQKYRITKVLGQNLSINYYEACVVSESADREKLFIINEIVDREKITLYIKDLVAIKTNDPLNILEEYFTENSKFYVVFKHEKGNDLNYYLQQENPSLKTRVELAKQILEQMKKHESYPIIIRSTIALPSNILMENSIFFAYLLQLEGVAYGISDADFYKNMEILMQTMFSEKEVETYKYLGFVQQKISKALYTSISEIISDFDSITSNEEASKLDLKIKKMWLKRSSTLIGIATVILVAFGLYRIYINSRTVETLGQEVTKIGTIPLEKTTIQTESTALQNEFVLVDNNKTTEQTTEYTTQKATEATTEQLTEPTTEPVTEQTTVMETEITTTETQQTTIVEVKDTEYIVTHNDNLINICKKYYNNRNYATALAIYNGISNKNLINPGMVLKLPPPEVLDEVKK